jgi:2,3-bisphosphoglycerate-independent phosphoglycerate mutase
LTASGEAVGLPEGQMGNSEVGHLNIGAGRIVYQSLTRVNIAIREGEFEKNETFTGAMEHVKKNGTNLHIYGLLSDGGVHSHNTHLYALLKLAKMQSFDRVFVHCFLDGRDTPPTSGKEYISELQEKIKEIGVGTIATVMGRYYAMDRDKRWERVKLAYDAFAFGKGEYVSSAAEAVEQSYQRDESDEFVKPKVIIKDEKPIATIKENDSVIFFNFRPDRAREITRSLVDESFEGFERSRGFFPLYYVCMTEYDAAMPNVEVAFEPEHLNNTFGEYISELGYTQLRIAETEKYAHVTFFFNGGVEEPYETRAAT